MKVCDVMSDGALTIDTEESVVAAARLMSRSNLGALPVCDGNGRLQGMLTDRDIVLRCVAAEGDCSKLRVGEVMSRGAVTVSPFDELQRAADIMGRHQLRRLPVVNAGRVVGMLSVCDMARSGNCDMEAAEALAEISSNFRRL